MSNLRPECRDSIDRAMSDDTALFLIRDAVARRRGLIHGKLTDHRGRHCALGAFWEDNPGTTLHSALIDEVAAVNDSIPAGAGVRVRWKKVNEWLRWKVKVLAQGVDK